MKNEDNPILLPGNTLWAKWMITMTPFLTDQRNQINATYLLDYNDLENSGFEFLHSDHLVDKNCGISWF